MSGALPGKKIAVIPLGVDGDVFRPLPDRVEVKRRLIPGGEDAFVVGCVARNQPRKQIPTLIKAFARFAHNKGDVFLWLHMAPQDVGWSLEELLDLHGLSGRSGFTSGLTPAIGLPDERLNEVYNAFDVMALPTAGEGFGLPLLESMAAGVPVLATDSNTISSSIGFIERRSMTSISMPSRSRYSAAFRDSTAINELVTKVTSSPFFLTMPLPMGTE